MMPCESTGRASPEVFHTQLYERGHSWVCPDMGTQNDMDLLDFEVPEFGHTQLIIVCKITKSESTQEISTTKTKP